MNLKTLRSFLTSATLETFLFSLLLILLPTQLGKHFWPEWSYVYSLRIDYLAVTVYLWDIVVYMLWVQRWIRGKRKIRGIRVFGIMLVVLVASWLPGIWISGDWGVGISRLVNVIPAGLFGSHKAAETPVRTS